jgi:membrane peptidoglycan carboxypeptidase
VWVGYPKDRTPLDDIEGVGVVTGATIPAQIWHDYMTTALQNVPPSDFPPPLHPADVQPYTPVRSSGPGSSTPYVAPPTPLQNTTTTSTTGTTTGTTGTTGSPTDTTGTGTTTSGN